MKRFLCVALVLTAGCARGHAAEGPGGAAAPERRDMPVTQAEGGLLGPEGIVLAPMTPAFIANILLTGEFLLADVDRLHEANFRVLAHYETRSGNTVVSVLVPEGFTGTIEELFGAERVIQVGREEIETP